MAERPAHSRHSKSGVPAPPRGLPPPRTGESTLKKVPASTNLKRAKASEHHHHNNKVDTRCVQQRDILHHNQACGGTERRCVVVLVCGRSHVPRNSKGGVLVSEEEIEAAFRFLDVHGTGRVTLHNLKKRLSLIYKGLPPSQYKLLLGEGKSEMTLKDLKDLLLDNTVDNFDPVAEAYKVLPLLLLMERKEGGSWVCIVVDPGRAVCVLVHGWMYGGCSPRCTTPRTRAASLRVCCASCSTGWSWPSSRTRTWCKQPPIRGRQAGRQAACQHGS